MPKPLQTFEKGQPPTLIEAAYANALTAAVEALRNSKVSPNGYGEFKVTESNTILDLGPFVDQIKTLIQQLVTEQVTLIVQEIKDRQDKTEQRINNPQISVTCEGGNIKVSLTL